MGTRMVQVAKSATALCLTSAGGLGAALAQTTFSDEPLKAGETPKRQSETLTVHGVRSLVSDKLPGGIHNTPQTVTVVPQGLIKSQAITRLQDALKNVPGITLNAGEGAARGDTVNLRGFPAFNDFFLDGIRDAAIYTRDSFNLEQVEVLKGPSAVLFGRGSTGGAINQVSKAPSLDENRSLTAEAGTNSLARLTTDIDEPIGPNAAFRLNAMAERSEVTDRDDVLNRRWGVAPSLAFGINQPTSLILSYLHQSEDDVPDVGIPFVDGKPANVPRANDYGLQSNSTKATDDIATARLKHEFSDDLSITNTFRYAHYLFDYRFSAPNLGDDAPPPNTPLSDILVGRDAPSSAGLQTNITDQTDAIYRFDTGPVSHTLLAGIEVARQTLSLGRYNNPFNSNFNWVPATPLLNPDSAEIPPVEAIQRQQNTIANSFGAYITDTIHLGPYVDVTGGVRWDRFSAHFTQQTVGLPGETRFDRVDEVASPRAAIVFKATPRDSLYFSYGTSFDPSAEALALTAATAALGPVKAKTFEVGAKTDWLHNRLSINGALFHTVVDNAQTNDPDNPTITTLAGNQRVNGGELSISGHLTEGWEIFGGYTYLDGQTTAAGNESYVGKQLQNVAKNAVNLWTVYEFGEKYKVGFGGNYLGRRYADFGEQASIPAYVVFNAMVAYKVNDAITLQVNGTNLGNKVFYDAAYYTSVGENHVIPGPGRTFTLTTGIKF
jgi:catecholate siderophore receptor